MEEQLDKIYKKLDIIEQRLSIIEFCLDIVNSPESLEDDDTKYKKIVDSLKEFDKVSVSSLQRKFSIGYSRAAKFLDRLEADKLVEPAKRRSHFRKVIKT